MKSQADEIKVGDRLRVIGHTYFGQHLGYDDIGRIAFLDEETNEITYYRREQVEKTYVKWF